jgi:hypothetical protein
VRLDLREHLRRNEPADAPAVQRKNPIATFTHRPSIQSRTLES